MIDEYSEHVTTGSILRFVVSWIVFGVKGEVGIICDILVVQCESITFRITYLSIMMQGVQE